MRENTTNIRRENLILFGVPAAGVAVILLALLGSSYLMHRRNDPPKKGNNLIHAVASNDSVSGSSRFNKAPESIDDVLAMLEENLEVEFKECSTPINENGFYKVEIGYGLKFKGYPALGQSSFYPGVTYLEKGSRYIITMSVYGERLGITYTYGIVVDRGNRAITFSLEKSDLHLPKEKQGPPETLVRFTVGADGTLTPSKDSKIVIDVADAAACSRAYARAFTAAESARRSIGNFVRSNGHAFSE